MSMLLRLFAPRRRKNQEDVAARATQVIAQVLTDIGYHGYITIEQERDPRNSGTSLRDVTESLNYLQGAGF